MNWSVQIDNEKKDIWIIGKEPTQGLDHNTLTEEVNILLILHNHENHL